jgi:hypothetical protein
VVNPFVVRGSASVITVVIGSVKCRQPSALFELVEAATRKDSKGLARNNVGLELPAISQVTAVDDHLGTQSVARPGADAGTGVRPGLWWGWPVIVRCLGRGRGQSADQRPP